jgi:acyl-CoA thioesterase FadM
MTQKTIRYTCELARGETKIATGTITVACVRTRPNGPMRSTTIPPEIAERFQVAPDVDP